ncbi:hypothetical protein GCM10009416_41260 [Craurococcus roseus]|uniref:Uncharacterized protein n=1 Tax=Craurococcus roseus TaxID=77585 RepID=A0ABP3QWP8_9PROT
MDAGLRPTRSCRSPAARGFAAWRSHGVALGVSGLAAAKAIAATTSVEAFVAPVERGPPFELRRTKAEVHVLSNLGAYRTPEMHRLLGRVALLAASRRT